MPVQGIEASAKFLRPLTLRMQIISNNLANVNSTGFKKGSLFIDLLNDQQALINDGSMIGEYMPNAEVKELSDFSQGSLEQTNNTFDFAIDGPGFFAVDTSQGTRYTRAGNFTLTVDGEIETRNGDKVLGDTGGPISIPNFHNVSKEDISITPLGDVLVKRIQVGKLKIVDFENHEKLTKIGNSLFMAADGQDPIEIDADKTFVRQGFLEESNVDGIEEMIQMIDVARQFETGQKLIQSQDQSLGRSLEVGRLG